MSDHQHGLPNDVLDVYMQIYRPVEPPVLVPMLPSNSVCMLLIVLGLVPMVVHMLVVVHVLVVVDVLSRLLVGVLVLVVVPLLVLVGVVMFVLMHNPNCLSLPLLEQAGRGERGCKKRKQERQDASNHSRPLFSTKVEMRRLCALDLSIPTLSQRLLEKATLCNQLFHHHHLWLIQPIIDLSKYLLG